MNSTIVRYTLKPDRLDEHLALIDAVFAGLADVGHSGIHYAVYRSAEGFDFTHIAGFDSQEAREAFGTNTAFEAFTADIANRCESPPDAVPQVHVHAVG